MASLGPSSFHPVLTLPIPSSFFQPPQSCTLYLLFSLPPTLFLDPWKEPISAGLDFRSEEAKKALRDVRPSVVDGSGSVKIVKVDYLNAGHPAKVELERAVGWTLDDTVPRRRGRSDASSSSSSSSSSFSPRVDQDESETVLLQLEPQRNPSSPSPPHQDAQCTLSLPLQARYPPPTFSPSFSPPSLSSFSSSFSSLFSQESYHQTTLHSLDLLWSCSKRQRGFESDRNLFSGWEVVAGGVGELIPTDLYRRVETDGSGKEEEVEVKDEDEDEDDADEEDEMEKYRRSQTKTAPQSHSDSQSQSTAGTRSKTTTKARLRSALLRALTKSSSSSSSPLPSSGSDSAGAGSTPPPTIYRLTHLLGSTAKANEGQSTTTTTTTTSSSSTQSTQGNDQMMTMTIALPRGEAAMAEWTYAVTLSVVCLAAVGLAVEAWKVAQ